MNDEELQKYLRKDIDATINYLAATCNLETNKLLREIVSPYAIMNVQSPDRMYELLLEITKRVAERLVSMRIDCGKKTVAQIREMCGN